jgi:Ca2+-binding EF-hand superfamily protein
LPDDIPTIPAARAPDNRAGAIGRIFQLLDRDNDGEVSRSEIPSNREGLLNAFETLDVDDNGSLSPDELRRSLRKIPAPGGGP